LKWQLSAVPTQHYRDWFPDQIFYWQFLHPIKLIDQRNFSSSIMWYWKRIYTHSCPKSHRFKSRILNG
jgi:hypothetical protein